MDCQHGFSSPLWCEECAKRGLRDIQHEAASGFILPDKYLSGATRHFGKQCNQCSGLITLFPNVRLSRARIDVTRWVVAIDDPENEPQELGVGASLSYYIAKMLGAIEIEQKYRYHMTTHFFGGTEMQVAQDDESSQINGWLKRGTEDAFKYVVESRGAICIVN